MKITIEDGSTRVILENTDSVESAKTRKLLDVLFSVEPNRDSKRTPTVVTSVVDSRPEILNVPVDPKQFGLWLNDRSPAETAGMLSRFVGADITQYNNLHSLIIYVPKFAYKLGFNRYTQAVKWLHSQGWIYTLPQLSSMRTYYSKALRIKALNA